MGEPDAQPIPAAEDVLIEELKPHPRNYRAHPEDQVEHLAASLQQHGFYRNIVIASDGTILAGHGIVAAARSLDYETVPAVRLDVTPNSPQALKILAADNELTRFAEVDDRGLTELLREIRDDDLDGLLGTGYDDMAVANLLMVTRPASEVKTFDAAAEWVGMPDYEAAKTEGTYKFVINFATEDDCERFLDEYGMRSIVAITRRFPSAISGVWPRPMEARNPSGVKYVTDDD